MKKEVIITKPLPHEYPEWYAAEIAEVSYDELIQGFKESFCKTFDFLLDLDVEILTYRYEPGKWTIKEMWQHIIDTERILCYRALRYARGDQNVLHPFDENEFAAASNAQDRNWRKMLQEYTVVRNGSIMLFESFDDEMLERMGTAGKSKASVRALGFLILGHEIHHINTINEKYLSSWEPA
ncbi:MAG: DinB family protein [Bacteroidota bacterium]|nr:DinB family protein [Bacteroidota bacterium]